MRPALLRMRFGLTDGQPKTLDEIGKVYGVTRERIRQIESKTMSKLSPPITFAGSPRLSGLEPRGIPWLNPAVLPSRPPG